MIIKKINVLSAVKIVGLVYAVIGFIGGIIFAVMTIFGYGVETETGVVPVGKTIGFISIFLFPLIYGFLGAVSGCVLSFLYNCVAKRIGGLDVEVE